VRYYLIVVLFCCSGFAATGPTISAVLNGASYTKTWCSGTFISIFGQNLASAARGLTGEDFTYSRTPPWVPGVSEKGLPFLPTTLNNVTVRINGLLAYLSYVSPTQINALTPDDNSVGLVVVQVTNENGTASTTATKDRICPALIMFDRMSRRYVAAVNQDNSISADPSVFPELYAVHPAVRGQYVSLYGTGFGAVTPSYYPAGAVAAGDLAVLVSSATVLVGGVPVTPRPWIGLAPYFAGLYQINLRVPDLPSGDHRVSIQIDGLSTQTDAFLTVAAPK
jgi:uncharacterized protein (TIGR03437 family)